MKIYDTSTGIKPIARKLTSQFSEMFDENQKVSDGRLGIVEEKHMKTKRGT